jgi:hypothetical protein
MNFAAWNPRLDFQGGTDEAKWMKAEALVAALGDRVTDLGAGSWRVMGFDAPTKEGADLALARMLDDIDRSWPEVLAIVND